MTSRPPLLSPCPLKVSSVSKHFGAFHALQDINLEIQPGEIFALLGPNGAGKSTLINSICGLSKQSSGSIEVFGHNTIDSFREARQLVGLVPQEINFDPFFTPHESLLNQMGYMGVEPNSDWADELLARMALSDHRNAYTRNLSGGMKRRLLVAKALVHRPKLLFLDEPTAGVDVELRRHLWEQVLELREQGTTIILTTHYLEEAEELADRIGVIHRGQIRLVEEKASLMERSGTKRFVLRVSKQPEDLPAGLRADSALLLSGQWSSPRSLTEALAALEGHCDVLDIQIHAPRLEDVFVELIREAESADQQEQA